MKRVGVGVAIVAVLLVCWLLLDASGVLRSERRTSERTTATRDDVSDAPENVDSDSPDSPDMDEEAPALPAPVDLTKVDLDPGRRSGPDDGFEIGYRYVGRELDSVAKDFRPDALRVDARGHAECDSNPVRAAEQARHLFHSEHQIPQLVF